MIFKKEFNKWDLVTTSPGDYYFKHVNPVIGGIHRYRADSRFAPGQWETALLFNDVSHWLGASLKSACKWRQSSPNYHVQSTEKTTTSTTFVAYILLGVINTMFMRTRWLIKNFFSQEFFVGGLFPTSARQHCLFCKHPHQEVKMFTRDKYTYNKPTAQ